MRLMIAVPMPNCNLLALGEDRVTPLQRTGAVLPSKK